MMSSTTYLLRLSICKYFLFRCLGGENTTSALVTLDTPLSYGEVCRPTNMLNLNQDLYYADFFDDGDPVMEWLREIEKIMDVVYFACSAWWECEGNVSYNVLFTAITFMKCFGYNSAR